MTLFLSLNPSEIFHACYSGEIKDKTEKERERRDVTNYSAVRHQDGTMRKPDKEYKKTKNKLD